MIFEYSSYRVFLRDVLAERITRNPAYSLRSMAKGLGLSPASLSRIQKGQRNLSFQNAVRVSRKLQLKEKESEYFCYLVQLESSKSPDVQEELLNRIRVLRRRREVHRIPLDRFRLIADWYHIPILEMTDLKGFIMTPLSIASRLGISAIEAGAAVDRLVRLGLIERRSEGVYRKTRASFMIEAGSREDSLLRFHRKMLEKAMLATAEQPLDRRFIGTETCAIDRKDLPEAKKRIGKFMDDLVAYFGPGRNKTEIYHLGIQLFRVTGNRRTS
jgi:uncharacterized protein (TIGR02147 family)